MDSRQETSGCGQKRMPMYTLRPPPPPCAVIMEKADPSLVTQGWVGDRPCLMTSPGMSSMPDGPKDC
jgi:hypothetical protein